MTTTTVKRHDTYTVSWTANANLTGCTARILIGPKVSTTPGSGPTVLSATITDAANGVVSHALTGTLRVGTYNVEVEVTTGLGVVTTFPNSGYETLVVERDLG